MPVATLNVPHRVNLPLWAEHIGLTNDWSYTPHEDYYVVLLPQNYLVSAIIAIDNPNLQVDPSNHTIVRIAKIDFFRLFTDTEKAKVLALQAHLNQMTAADYQIPENMGYIQLRVAFMMWELASDIQLTHIDTSNFLAGLVYAGILGPDIPTGHARVARILQGLPPL